MTDTNTYRTRSKEQWILKFGMKIYGNSYGWNSDTEYCFCQWKKISTLIIAEWGPVEKGSLTLQKWLSEETHMLTKARLGRCSRQSKCRVVGTLWVLPWPWSWVLCGMGSSANILTQNPPGGACLEPDAPRGGDCGVGWDTWCHFLTFRISSVVGLVVCVLPGISCHDTHANK